MLQLNDGVVLGIVCLPLPLDLHRLLANQLILLSDALLLLFDFGLEPPIAILQFLRLQLLPQQVIFLQFDLRLQLL